MPFPGLVLPLQAATADPKLPLPTMLAEARQGFLYHERTLTGG